MIVLANIYDIKNCKTPLKSNLLVDTNCLIWTYYSKASLTNTNYQVRKYPQFLQTLLGRDNTLHYSCLTLSEVARVIQKLERELCEVNQGQQIRVKDFRYYYPKEWDEYIEELELTVSQLQKVLKNIDVQVDMPFSDSAFTLLKNAKLDMFDCYIVETMKKHGITSIVSDDTDFAAVSGINLFTANNRIIAEAKTQNMLLTDT